MNTRKLLVVDTSVLLYDPESIHSFVGNDVILPLIVLEELDRFKEKQALTGSNARRVNRYLDELRLKGSLAKGVDIPEYDITVRVVSGGDLGQYSHEFDDTKGDNKIIGAALQVRAQNPDRIVKVVTKDINLRIKCDAVGVPAEDYYKDLPKSLREGGHVYSGVTQLTLEPEDIDSYYRDGWVSLNVSGDNIYQNQLVIGTSPLTNQSLIGIVKGNKIVKPKINMTSTGIEPRSKEQKAALHLLTDPDVPLISLTGLAGSGKTFLALVAAISGLNEKKFERIIITRSIEPVGRDIGFLPGTIDEKMAPWIMPIVDNFRNAFHDHTYFEMMQKKGVIEVSPISHIRGRSFSKCFIIVDECQNLTIHELKTIITRTGEGTKMVLLGDTDQVDTPYMDRYSNGLSIAIERLKGHELFGHVHLDKGERSPLATLASQAL